jgi:hypothetical protein
MIALMLVLIMVVTPVSVTFNDGETLGIARSDAVLVPTEDDVLGYTEEYPQPLFVAHDYLAGDHIKNMMKGGYVTVNFSDGTSEKLVIKGYLNLKFDSMAKNQYIDEGCFYFQTCNGEGILTMIACKIEEK